MNVRQAGDKGKGVFANKRYAKGALVLSHEILAVPDGKSAKVRETFFDDYMFFIGGVYFLALGEGSLLNHSADPNLYYTFRKKTRRIEFYALRTLRKDEELTIDYEWDSYPWEK